MTDKYCKVCSMLITDPSQRVYCSMDCMEKEYSKTRKSVSMFHKFAEERIRTQNWKAMDDDEQLAEMNKFTKDYLDGKI